MTILTQLHVIRLLALGMLLILPATSGAQRRPPILEKLTKTYGLESFGQIEAIRYTFNAEAPGLNVSRLSTWEPKTPLDERGVTFRYKDYRRDGQARYRTMTLSADEFIRCFLLHVLPKAFHRIRHYGLLASAGCKANIARARELMAAPMAPVDPPAVHDTADPHATTDHRPPCPCCGGRMIIIEVFARDGAPRGPPSSGPGVGS
jgi:hypothetical protein